MLSRADDDGRRLCRRSRSRLPRSAASEARVSNEGNSSDAFGWVLDCANASAKRQATDREVRSASRGWRHRV
ncbi:hypothetical protein L1887_50270 [Cichorium endivia]|nr:hypothetical protein L1887_50270 [Cichorium endivia]